MEYTVTKKSIMSKVALFGLLIMTSSYAYSTAETILNSFSKSFYTMEKKLSSFFNSSDKTSYAAYVDAIYKDFTECENALDAITRSPQDGLATLAYEAADYGRQMFSAVFGVIKKYLGKPATLEQAKNFQTDLERVFNPDTAFKKIVNKLETLKKKAIADNQTALIKQIETIIKMIEAKRKEWDNKQKYALLAGLTTRMSC